MSATVMLVGPGDAVGIETGAELQGGISFEEHAVRHPISKVGTTRSGRAIVTFLTTDEIAISRLMEEFALADHFDAWAVFQRLTIRAKRRIGEEADEYVLYIQSAERHRRYLNSEFITAQMQRLSLATAIDLMRFAAPLTEHVFFDD